MNFGRLTLPQRISLIAILVVAVAAFFPWISIFGITAIGVEGDGVITLLLAIAGGALLAVTTGLVGAPRTPNRGTQIALVALAGVVVLIALLDMNEFAAFGLYLTLLGGIAWVVGAAWELKNGTVTAAPSTDGPHGQV